MLVSKLYAATMAAGAPEPAPAEREAHRPPPADPRRPAAAPPPPAGRPPLRFRRGPRGTTRIVVAR